jgi:peptidyl-prolyl cis-trans isomerase D
MAAIQKIRSKSGLLVIVVGVALAAFVLGDLFKNMGRQDLDYDPTVMAYINGDKLPSNYFQERYEDRLEVARQQEETSSLEASRRFQLMTETWDLIKKEELIRQEAAEIGLAVENGQDGLPGISVVEYREMIVGENPHQYIRQQFSNQQTGEFDPEMVRNWLNSVEQAKNSDDPEQREQAFESAKQWASLEAYLKFDRLLNNYLEIAENGFYMPKALAKQDFIDQNETHSVRYFAVRYKTVNDSDVTLTEADYKAYYDEHKNEFKQDKETRDLKYVVWNVNPSEEDINEIQNSVAELYSEFKNVSKENLGSFLNRNSAERLDTTWKKPNELSPFIDSNALKVDIGHVFNPFRENEAFNIAKLVDRQARPDSMKAEHILIQFQGSFQAADTIQLTKDDAKLKADSLKKIIEANPENFPIIARQNSNDPSVTENSGNLDWFADGSMIPEFNQACLANEVGDVVVVETAFGYHVIHILDKLEAVEKVQMAKVVVPITFSNETYDKVYNEASLFAGLNRTYESFDTAVVNQGLNLRESSGLEVMSQGIAGVEGSRDIVKWAFAGKTKEGTVSDIFDYEDKIVVAALVSINEKGIQPLEDVKEDIEILVRREAKAKYLLDKLKGKSDFAAIASENGIMPDTIDFLSFKTYSLPKYGPEPYVQGRMTVAEVGKTVGPVKGDQGVYFFVVDKVNEAPEETNFQQQIQAHNNLMRQRVRGRDQQGGEIYEAVVEKAEVEDFRRFFY